MWNLHLLALVHPGVKCAQYVVSHLSCNFVKHSFPAASSTLSELVSIVQFVILLISAPIVNPLAFQEIWTQPMEGIIPPTYSLRFVIYLLRPHSFWTWLREIHTDTISLGECRGTASAGTISSEILPGVQQLRNASRRALHLWTGRDAAHVAFGIDFFLCPNINWLRLQKQRYFQGPSPFLQWLWSSMPSFYRQQIANWQNLIGDCWCAVPMWSLSLKTCRI